jgi:hypothetical protein
VIAIIPTADRQKATVKVRIGFEKLDARVLPDMGVKVAFQASGGEPATGQRACVIPANGLRQAGGRDVVLVLRNGKLEQRAVTVAGTRNEETLVSAGLEVGEQVVVEGPSHLKEGDRVAEVKP